MKLMHIKIVTLLLLLAAVTPAMHGETSVSLDSLYTSPSYEAYMDTLYNARPVQEISAALGHLRDYLIYVRSADGASAVVEAHALALTGKHFIVEDYCHDIAVGKQYLQEAEKILEQSQCSEASICSQAAVVKAEIAGSYFLTDQAAYLFTYGLSSSKHIEEALSIAPDNIHAQIMLANKYFYTPGLFGGSLRKARSILETIDLTGSSLPEFQLFTVLQLKGLIASKSRDTSAALIYFRQALELYPENNYLQNLESEITGGIH
jgi:tetratricopeptide (TPR) repeat protein